MKIIPIFNFTKLFLFLIYLIGLAIKVNSQSTSSIDCVPTTDVLLIILKT